jgi:diketogulonate reductase-like aldo/keto reductase
MTKTPLTESITLNTGAKMPILGLGVYRSAPGPETEKAVLCALEEGYRHIDTAASYRNERDVGAALRASGLNRSEIFVTTKLWTRDQGYDSALRACDASLKALGLDYVDLYLIHWPTERKRRESWRAFRKLHEQGLCRAIGVSNYLERHLEEVLTESAIVPAVNQVEFNPFLFQKGLLDFCRGKGIQLEAYSPLTQGERLHSSALVKLAAKYKKTPAQLLIRWAIEHSVVVIPKSVKATRIRENAEVFDFTISREDLALMDRWNENLRVCWDPTDVP